jgi:hypothetical protein
MLEKWKALLCTHISGQPPSRGLCTSVIPRLHLSHVAWECFGHDVKSFCEIFWCANESSFDRGPNSRGFMWSGITGRWKFQASIVYVVPFCKAFLQIHYMLSWHSFTCFRFRFGNEIAISCLFTKEKGTNILNFEPSRWSALNMRFVEKQPSKMQGGFFLEWDGPPTVVSGVLKNQNEKLTGRPLPPMMGSWLTQLGPIQMAWSLTPTPLTLVKRLIRQGPRIDMLYGQTLSIRPPWNTLHYLSF